VRSSSAALLRLKFEDATQLEDREHHDQPPLGIGEGPSMFGCGLLLLKALKPGIDRRDIVGQGRLFHRDTSA
jgi:hypothetical protein